MRELLRGAVVVARRDFSATVFSRSFLLFLLAPLFPVFVGLIFGGLTASTTARVEQPPVAVIAGEADFAIFERARGRLAAAFGEPGLIRLERVEPLADSGVQRQRLLAEGSYFGVLDGSVGEPRFSSRFPPPESAVRQVALLIDQARNLEAQANPGPRLAVSVAQCPVGSPPNLGPQRMVTAQAAQAVLFVLTILLGTMLLSQLIEEKSNKVIEVLAAAIPIGSIFLGKLVAMLAVSLLGVLVWGSAGATALTLLAPDGLSQLPPPAVGWPVFIALGLVYFSMSYLLIGAIFLGIGGHASSAREVQILSMPVTVIQVVIFAIAALAIGDPNSVRAIGAALFPLSSPYVMVARAAQIGETWPHLLAVPWQLLWVGLILAGAARLFRRSVLKSGPDRRREGKARA